MVDLFTRVRASQGEWFAMVKLEKGLKFPPEIGRSKFRKISISQILSIHSFCKEAMSEMLETVLRSLT